MPFNIVKAADRLKIAPKINMMVLGPIGIGKTFQARTMPPDKTLFADAEAGTLSLGDWGGETLDLRKAATEVGAHPWEVAQAFATLIGGPDPLDASGPYGAHYLSQYEQVFGPRSQFDKYEFIYVDSITVLSRWCFAWAQTQPDAFNKEGKPDTRGAYGILGREMVKFITHLQHSSKSMIFACILEQSQDKFERPIWEAQIMGQASGRELPGIIDEVVTLQNFEDPTAGKYRAFVTHQDNPWKFPAKDRSGCLDLQEPPDLWALLQKIRAGKRLDGQMVTSMPAPAEPQTETQQA